MYFIVGSEDSGSQKNSIKCRYLKMCVYGVSNQESSVGISTNYMLDDRGYIPGQGKIYFSTPQRPDWLRGRRLFAQGQSGCDVKVTTHLYPVSRSRMVELYLHNRYSFMP
jgi:hypothetical protein